MRRTPAVLQPAPPAIGLGHAPLGALSCAAMQSMAVLARRFPLLMIAPEGTTKNLNVLLRFSTGAFVPGRPVLPVLLM